MLYHCVSSHLSIQAYCRTAPLIFFLSTLSSKTKFISPPLSSLRRLRCENQSLDKSNRNCLQGEITIFVPLNQDILNKIIICFIISCIFGKIHFKFDQTSCEDSQLFYEETSWRLWI